MMDILKYSLNLSNVIEVYDPFINGALSGLKSFIEGNTVEIARQDMFLKFDNRIALLN